MKKIISLMILVIFLQNYTYANKIAEDKNEAITNLINSKSNVEEQYNNILNIIKKDKYESTKEYEERMNNLVLDTSFVLTSDILEKNYNPDTKKYSFKFKLTSNLIEVLFTYEKGEINFKKSIYIKDKSWKKSLGYSKGFYETSNVKVNKETPYENGYGNKFLVDEYFYTTYKVVPTNFNEIVKSNANLKIENDYLIYTTTVTKDEAKLYDSKKFIFKINGTFDSPEKSFFKGFNSIKPTISKREHYVITHHISKAKIDNLILCDEDCKDIIFQY